MTFAFFSGDILCETKIFHCKSLCRKICSMNAHILKQLQRGKHMVILANEHFPLSGYRYPFSPSERYVAEIIIRSLIHTVPPGHSLVVGPSQDAFHFNRKEKAKEGLHAMWIPPQLRQPSAPLQHAQPHMHQHQGWKLRTRVLQGWGQSALFFLMWWKCTGICFSLKATSLARYR